MDEAFNELINRLRQGDAWAASELVAGYEAEIRRFVRFRLRTSRMRRLLESVDISQSVFAKFFVDIQREAVCPQSPEQLRALLIAMAKHKLIDQVRYNHAAKRDLNLIEADGAMALDQAVNTPRSPGSILAEKEVLDAVQKGLTPEERELVAARLAGRSWSELAESIGSTPEATRKRVTRLIDALAQQVGARS